MPLFCTIFFINNKVAIFYINAMTLKKIIHIDMDCFYASIEMRDNPSLKDKPLAVGGNSRQRGVLTTCNYLARQFGLHSAMPTAQAVKLCPNLILVPVNMPLYKQISKQIHSIFHRYTDLVEPLSLDEAYLDVTHCHQCSGSATWIAEEIRKTIFKETGLTASAGVAPVKFLAKIASDCNKPNGSFVINPQDVDDFVKKLPLKKIPGVGKVTTERLLKMGLKTCEDVQNFDQSVLLNQFGKMGMRLWYFAHGVDERDVQPNRERKSVTVEKTLLKNITHIEQGLAILEKLYPILITRIKNTCPNIALSDFHKVGVKLKFDDFTVTTLEKSAVEFSKDIFKQLLIKIWQRSNGREIRLIGIQVTIPEQCPQKQMTLW
ncbi:DNA polymerase-4 [Bisgaardia hudsonensis]|uniref:DNA polymerase IV n=2 Tax=Bisgaardia hudsonensis TaxID=109472 RepID=A0A4R2N1A4_9PAST|nr:DNA polymerase-4 [Bisgaardia hudsonensis]